MGVDGATVATAGAPGKANVFELHEVKQHITEDDCWLVIHGKVYDVTKFLDEHPGGFDIIISNTGKDATEDFEEIGHSNAAKEMLEKYLVGDFAGGDVSVINKPSISAVRSTSTESSSSQLLFKALQVLLPVIFVVAAIFVPRYLL